jgi:hypothetical protein
MSPIEGLTIIHVLAAVLGTVLFLVALGLLVRAALKNNIYPATLVSCIVIGAALIVFPVTKKLEFNSMVSDMTRLTAKVEKNPNDLDAKRQLKEKVERIEKSPSLSPKTTDKLRNARRLIEH